MSEIPAEVAARVADEVYALTKYKTLKAALLYLNTEYGDLFTFPFSNENMLKGKTGGPSVIKCRTAFGFMLIGKGFLKGHAFFIFRGTQYLADWLTNMNVSTSSSSLGMPVHDGFNKTFKSIEPQLINYMGQLDSHNIHTVNCIGHSLGGAIATICGEWITKTYGRSTKIYTFGSPRVGLETFSMFCTGSVGANNIYRAYHKTDIVPCIPTWPFFHTPLPGSGRDYYLPSPGIIPMAEYHGMDKYIKSVSGKSWDALAGLRSLGKDEGGIKRWLTETVPASISMASINNLSEALSFVIKKCFEGAYWLLSKSFSSSFTFMDQLAYILEKGINLAGSASIWVLKLIKKIMQMLGMVAAVKLEDLNVKFMREVLVNMQLKINRYTKDAFTKVMVDGREI